MTTQGNSQLSCLACGLGKLEFLARARDIEYYSVPEIFSYFSCKDCGALSISPVPEDRLHVIYPPTYYSFSGQHKSIAEKVKQYLDRRLFRSLFHKIDPAHARKTFSVLDVGGGSGWLLGQAKQVEPRLKKTVIVDIDNHAGNEARKAGHEYFHGRIEDFETGEKFDLILMLNLIEHVKDPVSILKKMKTLLAPDGLILIKTPNHDSLDARLFRRRGWGGFHCPRHWVLFSPESFRRAAAKAGLDVESLALTQGAPFWAWSVLNLMKDFGLVTISYEKPAYRSRLMPVLLIAFAGFDFLRRPFMRTSQMFVVLRKPGQA